MTGQKAEVAVTGVFKHTGVRHAVETQAVQRLAAEAKGDVLE